MSESQSAVAPAQTFRVEVAGRSRGESAVGRGLVEAAHHLGVAGLIGCAVLATEQAAIA